MREEFVFSADRKRLIAFSEKPFVSYRDLRLCMCRETIGEGEVSENRSDG